jgi:hypothetical protein
MNVITKNNSWMLTISKYFLYYVQNFETGTGLGKAYQFDHH